MAAPVTVGTNYDQWTCQYAVNPPSGWPSQYGTGIPPIWYATVPGQFLDYNTQLPNLTRYQTDPSTTFSYPEYVKTMALSNGAATYPSYNPSSPWSESNIPVPSNPQVVPTVTGVSPATGPQSGYTQITITGTGFTGLRKIHVNGVNSGGQLPSSPSKNTAQGSSPAVQNNPAMNTQAASVAGEYSIRVTSDTSATAYVPVSTVAAGTAVKVAASNSAGRGTSASTLFTYSGPPTIDAMSPAAPAAATLSTATTGGTVLAGVYQVELTYVTATGESTASTSASVTTSGSTSTITINSPATATGATGWYAYVTQLGGSTYTRQQTLGSPTAIGTNLTLTAPPTNTGANPPLPAGVIPAAGSTNGGQTITINGTGFSTGVVGTPTVTLSTPLGTYACTSVTVSSNTAMTAVTPAAFAGAPAWDLTVTTNLGTAILPGCFTFIAPGQFTSISPSTGGLNQLQTVTINGRGFQSAGITAVNFGGSISGGSVSGGVNATNFTIVSDTQITCTTPAGSAIGQTNIILVAPLTAGGPVSFPNVYTYSGGTIANFTPTSVPHGTPTVVTINGIGFTGATAVTLDGQAATGVTVVSDTQVTCTSPNLGSIPSPAAGPVVVTVPNQTLTSTANITIT